MWPNMVKLQLRPVFHAFSVICFFYVGLFIQPASANEPTPDRTPEQAVESLSEPLYSPFIERYVLDELKQLRTDMASQKHELTQQILDREHKSVDRAVAYATDTVTYFFYLIAAASSILVLIGWTSIRDIKDRVHSYANDEIGELVHEYESRLKAIEKQLKQKSQDIEDNREEIEMTQEIQSLWQRAARESNIANKVEAYDAILAIKPDDSEALIYKADTVLEIPEPQWAINLCHQALAIDPENVHALFQLACAHACMDNPVEAMSYLKALLEKSDGYMEHVVGEVMLEPLHGLEDYQRLMDEHQAKAV